MLHLEALENRCLLSNNGGLFVIAQAAVGDYLEITDSVMDDADQKMDFGTLSAGTSRTETITVANANNIAAVDLQIIDQDLSSDVEILSYTYLDDANVEVTKAYSELNGGTIELDPGEEVVFTIEIAPDAITEEDLNGSTVRETGIRFRDANSSTSQAVSLFYESVAVTGQEFELSSADVTNSFGNAGIAVDGILGTSYDVDVHMVLRNNLEALYTGTETTIDFTLESENLNIEFYLSADDTISADDTQVSGSISSLPAIAGGSPVDLYATLDLSGVGIDNGLYNILVSIDGITDTEANDVLENTIVDSLGQYLVFNGDQLILDSSFDIDNPSVGIIDSIVDFGDNPLLQNSDTETVTISNISDETITITSLDITGVDFILEYDMSPAAPAGFSDLRNVEIVTYNRLYGLDGEETNWVTFYVAEPSIVYVDAYLENDDSEYDNMYIYDQFGKEVDTAVTGDTTFEGVYDIYEYSYSGFVAPTSGLYYVEFEDLVGELEVAVERASMLVDGSNDGDTEFTHTPSIPEMYSITVDEATRFSLDISSSLNSYIATSSGIEDYDSLADFINIGSFNYYGYLVDLTDLAAIAPATSVTVYNERGVEIASYDYDVMTMVGEYVQSYYDAGNLATEAAEEFFDVSLDIVLPEEGTYYLSYSVDLDDYYGSNIYFIDYNFGYQFDYCSIDFDYSNEGNAYELSPGESLTVPLTFMADAAIDYSGDKAGKLTIATRDEVGSEIDYDIVLLGSGVSGDLAFESTDIVSDYPDRIQSGATTKVDFTIINNGDGFVTEDASVEFYLQDSDPATDDILLVIDDGTEEGVTSFDIMQALDVEYERDYFMLYDTLDFTADVVIPESIEIGEYTFCIKLVQDSSVVLDAETDIVLYEEVAIDPYQAIITDSDGEVISSITFESEETDGQMDFLVTNFGELVIGYIDIFNRDNDDLVISNIELSDSAVGHFYVSLDADLETTVEPYTEVVIASGEVQRVFVSFDPQNYSVVDLSEIEGYLTVLSSDISGEDIQYNIGVIVDNHDELEGGTLKVLESDGALTDGVISFPEVRVNALEPSQTFITLVNQGNDTLVVTELDFGVNSPFSIDSFNSSIIIPAGQSYDVTIYFDPETIGSADQELVIYSTDPGNDNMYTLTLDAVGVNPSVSVQEDSGVPNDYAVTFGNLAPVRAEDNSVLLTINNTDEEGTDTLGIENISVSTSAFSLLVVTAEGEITFDEYKELFDTDLERGETIQLRVSFDTDEVGSYNDVITIATDYEPIEVTLSGAISEPEYSLTTESGQSVVKENTDGTVVVDGEGNLVVNDFDTFAASSQLTEDELRDINILTFNIDGKSPVYISSISITGEGYSLDGADAFVPGVYESGDKIYVRVVFDMGALDVEEGVSLAGDYDGKIVINGSYDVSYAVTTEIVEADIELVDTSAQFEDTLIGQISSQFITVKNTGNSDLIINGFECDDSQFSLAQSVITIAPGQEAEVEVYYEPDTLESTTAQFTLLTNDRDETGVTVALTGNSGGNVLPVTKVSGNTYLYIFNNEFGERVKLSIKYVTSTEAKADSAPVVYVDTAGDVGNISLIEMPDSLASSKIVISGDVKVGDINAGSLSSITAKQADLDGEITLTGTVKSIVLDEVEAGSKLNVLNQEAIDASMSVVVDTIAENSVFNLSSMSVKTFQATDIAGGDEASITAGNITKLVVKDGDLASPVTSYNDISVVVVDEDILNNIFVSDSVKLIKAGGSIGEYSLIVAGTGEIAANAKASEVSTSGDIGKIIVGRDIDGDIRALDGDIGKILASRGSINGGIYADSLKSLSARNVNGASMAIDSSVGKMVVKYDVIDSVIGVGYDFSSLASTGYSAGNIESIIELDDPTSSNPVRSYKIGGEVSGSSIISFI